VLVGGAAINRDFGRRILYPHGKDSDDQYSPGVFYCKDAFQGLSIMDNLIDDEARQALIERIHREAKELREQPERVEEGPAPDAPSRSALRTDVEIPEPPFWGVREVDVDLAEVFPLLDTHVLFKLHWGGKGVKGEAWERLLADDFQPRLERMWREQDYLHPRAVYGYFPVNADGDDLVFFDPDDPSKEVERLTFPRQPAHDRLCLSDYWRPIESGERDVCVLQAVTVGPEVTKLCERLEAEGEFAEQLFVHGLGVQSAEGTAEWLHQRVRAELGLDADQGRRYSWGYPACPEQEQHVPVFKLLGAESIGLSLSHGFAVEPEQSTVAIVAHHPQASYFGMRSGRIPPDRADAQTADEVEPAAETAS
jgi:5-methyltetrahydrofolate--homocysteine methyltransferase